MKAQIRRVCCFTVLLCAAAAAAGIMADGDSVFFRQACAAAPWSNSDTVATNQGLVQGAEDNDTTWAWKGIPYARPPEAELRWQSPQDPDAWEGVRQCTEFCSWCPQTATENGATVVRGSEDCLYLNIWRPRTAATGLPVYVWIHGGSNKVGSADPYLGARLAGRHDLVVVTFNYRLGPLGWFTHPALRDGQESLASSGNYALLDIIQALAWVRDTIGAFGGDPNNVTVAGESAGGVNDLLLMISPPARGLFHRVISQSGGVTPKTQADGDAWADSVIEALLIADGTPEDGAADARRAMDNAEIRQYLRSKTADEFFAATAGLGGNPDVFNDGAVIPAEGADAFDDPETYSQVPVMIGSTSEEGKLFMYLLGLERLLPKCLYQLIGKAGTRITRITGLDSLAYKMSAHDSQPGVYCYVFAYGQYRRFGYNAWPVDTGPTRTMSWAMALGACHALDVPFNFGLFDTISFFGLNDLIFRQDNRSGREALSDAIMAYNARFARTGDPNVPGLAAWTPWPQSRFAAGPRFMIFDADDAGELCRMARDVP